MLLQIAGEKVREKIAKKENDATFPKCWIG